MRTSRLALLPLALLVLSPSAEAGRLTGRLLSDGAPVAGALVSAVPHESPTQEARRAARGAEPPAPLATAKSGPGGVFELAVPPGGKDSWFRVRIEARGFVPAELPGTYDAAEAEDVGDATLAKGDSLAGWIVGPGGVPVGGARVTLTPRFGPQAGSDLEPVPAEVTTGPDGVFRFEAAVAGVTSLLVEAEGLATTRREVPRGGALRGAIALAPAARAGGTVKRRDGAPPKGALARWEDGTLATRWVEVDENGAFRLSGLPTRAGRVVVDAGEEGWAESPAFVPDPAVRSLSLVLSAPALLEGKVVNAETSRPVPRAKVTVRTGGGTRVGRTGTDGRYRVGPLRPGETGVAVDEPRHVPWSREGLSLSRGRTRTLDVPLALGATLAGRVVDEAGRPVAEARGMVGRELGDLRRLLRGQGTDRTAFVTRADGTFRATRLAPGPGQSLAVSHADFERALLGGVALEPGRAKEGLLVTLRRGLTLAGKVRDGDGNPIAGAELTLSQSRAMRSSRGGAMAMVRLAGGSTDLPRARSGADGRFELRGLPVGDYTVRVGAPGWATETLDAVKVTAEEPEQPLEVVLSPGAAISGTVRRRSGGGAEGFLVFARPQGSGGAPGSALENLPTGPDGTFVLEGLRRGETYDLQAMGGTPGPGPALRGIVAPAVDVEIVVTGTGRVEGTAVDAKTGRPLTEFEAAYEPERGGGMVVRIARRGSTRGAAGDGGRIRVESDDGRFALEEVPAGKWSVVVSAKGYQVARAGGVVVEEGTTTEGLEVRAMPGSLLRGRVTDGRSGRPVVEASVSASGEGGPRGGLPPGLASLGDGGLLTDADGRFEVDGLPPGRVALRVEHPDYEERSETVELKEQGANVEIALSRGGTLGGTVLTPTRQPAPGAEVSLDAAGEGGRGPFGLGGETAITDGAGRFRFDHLPAGRYSATAQLSGQTSEPQSAILTAGEAREDLVLVLAGGATLRGVVTGLPEGRRAGVMIWASGPGHYRGSARSGPDGRFELGGLPVGTTTLSATAGDVLGGGTRSAHGSVTIAEGQLEAEAEVPFEGTASLSGTITRGGRPVAGAMVFASPLRGGSGSSTARADESGAYRIEGLADGEHVVNVQPSPGSGGQPVSRRVDVSGETTLDVEVPTASLWGFVVYASTKQPLEGARVVGRVEGGLAGEGRAGVATTDSNGRWSLDDVEPGPWTLTFRREGYLEKKGSAIASEAGGDAGTVELTRGAGLELRVTDGVFGIPLRGVSVRIRDGAGASVATTFVSLDGDGRGEVPSLPPGRYALVAESSGYAARRFDGVVVPGNGLPVVLTPGGAVEVRAGEVSRGKGSATLRDAAGRLHAVRAFGEEGRLPVPASGVATIPNLAPGSYTLAVDGVAPKGFTVAEGGRTVVELP